MRQLRYLLDEKLQKKIGYTRPIKDYQRKILIVAILYRENFFISLGFFTEIFLTTLRASITMANIEPFYPHLRSLRVGATMMRIPKFREAHVLHQPSGGAGI